MRWIVLAVLPLVVGAAPALEAAPRARFELTTWGMPGSPRFTVTLSSAGELTVIRERFPLTESGRTVTKVVRVLRPADADQLGTLAQQATDFAKGCGTVADGTSARLRIDDSRGGTLRVCDNAVEWPVGSDTKAFLEHINANLPKDAHVF